jgi:hypothetical protein
MLAELKPGAVDYLPLSQLRELFGRDLADSLFDRIIFWFSSDAVQLFEAWYEYLDDEVDEGGISPEELAHALRSGKLTLDSGRVVQDFREHLFPYFRGTDHLEAELRSARGSNG